jgi:hypothetical protein
VSSNPTLTVKERHRRYISLSKLLTELRYPMSTNSLSYIESNMAEFRANLANLEQMKKIEKNKVIPINIKD